MLAVKVNGEMRTYPEGTAFLEIAKEFQPQYEDDILLVRVNGKLMELHKTLKKDSEVSFITFKDPVGKKTYERSAIFILMKAFYEIIPREKIKKVQIDFALGSGIYGELVGDVELDAELLQKVKAEMRSIVEQEIPIMKRNINTDDAVELFHNYGMLDKEQLFKFRRASRVNIYSIEKFEDYYYGYMVQNTGYVKYFDLIPYHKGFLLRLPRSRNPKEVVEEPFYEKLFHVLRDSYRWSDKLEVPNVAALNKLICDGKGSELIMMQEALQEKNIGNIAEMAAKDPDKRIVMIAGPSSSGKTTFSHRLSTQLSVYGLKPHPIAADDYFVDRHLT
ncbi:MAG: nucleoside kinase, partial [Lachnospiraceae bacterium]|nr:nucleoside kinase [Lachnospiraceae bacterium]